MWYKRCQLLFIALGLIAFGQACSSPDLNIGEAKEKIKDYYNNESEFAGRFELLMVEDVRIEGEVAGERVVHAKYAYCNLDDCDEGETSGTDARTFDFALEGEEWYVRDMGGPNSARL